MQSHADSDQNIVPNGIRLPPPEKPPFSESPPRLVIIGAGDRGMAFGKAIQESTNGICIAIVEPLVLKRKQFGRRYIWGSGEPHEGQEFEGWKDFLSWEIQRRTKSSQGERVPEGCDGVFICVQDKMHKAVIIAMAPLCLHIMCEKPLASNLEDCISIFKTLQPDYPAAPMQLFSIGHVLRYSSHNILLRKLLLEDKVIGDIMAVNHTEPVGWWHFAHSFVRGNWRNESTSAPSLLTKSCHDIDLLLWLLCSPPPNSSKRAHLPSEITSTGELQYFNKGRKPQEAGDSTNCLSCSYESACLYSSKKIYLGSKEPGLNSGNTEWPIDVLVPDIEDCVSSKGKGAAEAKLLAKLQEDYGKQTPTSEISSRPWFGRCVYESDNDVCDYQTVTMKFDSLHTKSGEPAYGPKIATFNMLAMTKKVCERYTNISGTKGEISADSSSISIHNFSTGEDRVFYPHVAEGGHGAGDGGLARQFILAIDQVKNHGSGVEDAQREFIGCSVEEAVRSHAAVFAAEESRKNKTVIDFHNWWDSEVGSLLREDVG